MDKVLCETPAPGKQPTRIDGWKYDLVAEAILAVVPQVEPGVTFKQLLGLVASKLPGDRPIGSVSWYTTVVKLDLEVKGKLKRLPGKGPQRLVRENCLGSGDAY